MSKNTESILLVWFKCENIIAWQHKPFQYFHPTDHTHKDSKINNQVLLINLDKNESVNASEFRRNLLASHLTKPYQVKFSVIASQSHWVERAGSRFSLSLCNINRWKTVCHLCKRSHVAYKAGGTNCSQCSTVIVSVAAAGNGPEPSWLDVNSLTDWRWTELQSRNTHGHTPIVWPHL